MTLVRLSVRDKAKALARIIEDEDRPEIRVKKLDYPTKAKPYGLVVVGREERPLEENLLVMIFVGAYSVRNGVDSEEELFTCQKFSELLAFLEKCLCPSPPTEG